MLRASVKPTSQTSCVSVVGQRRGFQEIPHPAEKKAFPWRKETVETADVSLRTWVYNPFGKGRRPPQPIIGIPDNIWGSGKIFANTMRHSNYPYGFVGVDLRGRGESQMRNSDASQFTLQKHTEDMIDVLNFFHLNRAFFIGHGYGGYVAYNLAKKYPQRVSGIVLVDSGYPKILTPTKRDFKRTGFESLPLNNLFGEFKGISDVFNAAGLPPKAGNEMTPDEITFFKEVLTKKDNGTLALKSNPHAVKDELVELQNKQMPTLDQLWKIRHPVSLVTASNGIVSPDDAEVLKEVMNVKSFRAVPESNYSSLLLNNDHAKAVAEAMDEMVTAYDLHQQVVAMLEDVKEQVRQEQTQSSQAKTQVSQAQQS